MWKIILKEFYSRPNLEYESTPYSKAYDRIESIMVNT